MVDYEKLYLDLAGKLADTIEVLDRLSATLKKVQQENEGDIINDE